MSSLTPHRAPKEDYAVYDAVLNHFYGAEFSNIVIVGCSPWPEYEAEDDDVSISEYIHEKLPGVRSDTLTAFHAVRRIEDLLVRKHFSRHAAILAVARPLREAYALPELRADFPHGGGGFLFLSRIGFSANRQQALLYAAIVPHAAFPNGGFGFYLVADHEVASWTLDSALAWIA